jgi:ubiquinone/menaquinone biosynthesis C-methylase UbiE
MEKTYLSPLNDLVESCQAIPNTKMLALAKIDVLVVLNMRYEAIQIDRDLAIHPYELVERFVADSAAQIQSWQDIRFIESDVSDLESYQGRQMEEMHHDLFQMLWTKFNIEEYRERIARFEYRLDINGLDSEFLTGLRGLDFGCGHGNFAHALLNRGADYVLGIDYGEESVEFASRARDELGVSDEALEFKVASVYEAPAEDASFDFALQNGVFHHLDDEDRAYREAHRILKKGGWFWIYTDGEGAISHDLWDASRIMLQDVPPAFITEHLAYLNISTNKRYHMGDGLNAVYRHTTWEALTERLGRLGFEDFRRIVGGYDTDFDHDVIENDRYGSEKFGSGDLRLICRKA